MSSGAESGAPRDWSALMANRCDPDSEPSTRTPDPSAVTVAQTVLGLRSQDLATYDAVSSQPGASTKELAAELDRDRSNVNRSLTRLDEAGLVCRQRRLLESGGYFYAYFAEPSETVTNRLREALDRWTEAAASTIDTTQWNERIASDV
ncbi:helix-turn-helix domain-containing protein [Halohasta salina]|uniref:helix-turn-helix domain-containing protein n=1 Tax=Halohasta salina TaxID=2961621 RepID=UPI0020A4BF96|nr:helix-turn-helix domain-containing protein [Halohasta salina]